VIGWLLDTNVIAPIINLNGAPTVKAWAAAQAEDRLFLSLLSLDRGGHLRPVERRPGNVPTQSHAAASDLIQPTLPHFGAGWGGRSADQYGLLLAPGLGASRISATVAAAPIVTNRVSPPTVTNVKPISIIFLA
jgi:hypothetical protein